MGRGTSPTILRFGGTGGTPVVGPPYGMLSEPTAYSQGVYQEFIDGQSSKSSNVDVLRPLIQLVSQL